MRGIALKHEQGAEHHVRQGQSWLRISEQGTNSAALSYAALELRFAIERLAFEYWAVLLGRAPIESDFHDIHKFKNLENRIYSLAGHQRQINAHFAFMRIVLDVLKIDNPLRTPQLGLLNKTWQGCSELCHVVWPLVANTELGRQAFDELSTATLELESQTRSLGWPIIADPRFAELRTRFVNGNASEKDVRSYLSEIGLWAVEVDKNGKRHFIGEATPPSQ